MTDLIFVYGTLRRGMPSPMAAVMQAQCVHLGAGSVPGRLYDVGSYPALTRASVRTDRVFGDVFRMKYVSRILAELDAYEGCAPDSPQPHEYHRELQTVRLATGRTIAAWVYTYALDVARLRRIPGGDYVKWLGR